MTDSSRNHDELTDASILSIIDTELLKKHESLIIDLRTARQQLSDYQLSTQNLTKDVNDDKNRIDELEINNNLLQYDLQRATVEKNHAIASNLKLQVDLQTTENEVKELKECLSDVSKINGNGKRRRHEDLLQPTGLPYKRLKSRTDRAVPCTICYTHKWPCDGESPCGNCCHSGKAQHKCKRVKFQFFEKGTCWKKQCSLAHEEEYTNLIPFTRLKQKDGGPPPKPFIPKKSEDPRRGDDDDLYDELGLLR